MITTAQLELLYRFVGKLHGDYIIEAREADIYHDQLSSVIDFTTTYEYVSIDHFTPPVNYYRVNTEVTSMLTDYCDFKKL